MSMKSLKLKKGLMVHKVFSKFLNEECYHLNCDFMQIYINHINTQFMNYANALRSFYALIPVVINRITKLFGKI